MGLRVRLCLRDCFGVGCFGVGCVGVDAGLHLWVRNICVVTAFEFGHSPWSLHQVGGERRRSLLSVGLLSPRNVP